MREPNIEWPSSEETSDILAATGKTRSELEDLIRDSIRKAEDMAKIGYDYFGKIQTHTEEDWIKRWNDDEVLVMWFGRVEKANHVEDVHRRMGHPYERLASHVLTIHVRENLPQGFNAQNIDSFLSPDTFRVAVGWLENDLDSRAALMIHELLHVWFIDQSLSPGNKVYGAADAKALARTDPQKARRSPENYQQYCFYLESFLSLSFRPSVVNFGSVAPGESRTLTVTATNTARSGVTLSFPASSPKGIFRWAAFNAVVADGDEATFQVEFHPISNAIQRSTLWITSTAPASPHTLGLLGKGVGGFSQEPIGPPQPTTLQFSAMAISFGSVAVGSSATRTLTISNSTGASVAVSYPASPSGSVFQWSAFNGPIAHGTEHRVEITFRPASGAIANGSLTVTSATASGPTVVGLIGKGPGGFLTPSQQSMTEHQM